MIAAARAGSTSLLAGRFGLRFACAAPTSCFTRCARWTPGLWGLRPVFSLCTCHNNTTGQGDPSPPCICSTGAPPHLCIQSHPNPWLFSAPHSLTPHIRCPSLVLPSAVLILPLASSTNGASCRTSSSVAGPSEPFSLRAAVSESRSLSAFRLR